jgi:hypothetical protein
MVTLSQPCGTSYGMNLVARSVGFEHAVKPDPRSRRRRQRTPDRAALKSPSRALWLQLVHLDSLLDKAPYRTFGRSGRACAESQLKGRSQWPLGQASSRPAAVVPVFSDRLPTRYNLAQHSAISSTRGRCCSCSDCRSARGTGHGAQGAKRVAPSVIVKAWPSIRRFALLVIHDRGRDRVEPMGSSRKNDAKALTRGRTS